MSTASLARGYSVEKFEGECGDEWWVMQGEQEVLGPYKTKKEATEVKRGQVAFDKENKDVPEQAQADPEVVVKKTSRGVRGKLYGHTFTSVLRWMGKSGMDFASAKKVFDHHKVDINDTTIKIQLSAGQKGQRGEPAPLTKDEEKSIKALAK